MPRRSRPARVVRDRGPIASFVRDRRRALGYTQAELALRSGVGLRFLRELERGKISLRLDKVDQVLAFFGARLTVAPVGRTGAAA